MSFPSFSSDFSFHENGKTNQKEKQHLKLSYLNDGKELKNVKKVANKCQEGGGGDLFSLD